MMSSIFIFLVVLGLILIGFLLGKGYKRQVSIVNQLINLFKFIIKTELLSKPGKANLATGALVIIAALVIAFPFVFIIIYQMIFGDKIVDTTVFHKVFYYFMGCMIPISIIEALIEFKEKQL